MGDGEKKYESRINIYLLFFISFAKLPMTDKKTITDTKEKTDAPPYFKTWNRLYAFVLLFLGFLILLFVLLSKLLDISS